MLESLEFTFGGNTYKVAEAGLMFAYEIGMENGRIYVVALSENFGTIIFYIPEETAEKIKEHVQELPCSFRSYLHFLIEYKEFEKFLGPARYYGVSIKEEADALALALNAVAMAVQDAAEFLQALAATAYDENIQEPAPVPNNWLKMHSLPMRRKGSLKSAARCDRDTIPRRTVGRFTQRRYLSKICPSEKKRRKKKHGSRRRRAPRRRRRKGCRDSWKFPKISTMIYHSHRGKKHGSGFKIQRFRLSRYSGGKGDQER